MIDSNGRYLDHRKLWTVKGTEFRRCGNMFDVDQYWSDNKTKFTNLKYLFISVGCNDLVSKTPHEYFTSVHKFVENVWLRYPDVKIVLSEVTPRMDHVDTRVKEANVLLRQYAQGFDNIFLTLNSNLRNPDNYFDDGIHLKHHIIPRFAANIKRALRAAYGIKFERKYPTRRVENDERWSNGGFRHQSTLLDGQQLQMFQKDFIDRLVKAFGYVGT